MKRFIIKWLMNNIDIKREIIKVYDGKIELISVNRDKWKFKKDKWNNLTLSFWYKKSKTELKDSTLNGEIENFMEFRRFLTDDEKKQLYTTRGSFLSYDGFLTIQYKLN